MSKLSFVPITILIGVLNLSFVHARPNLATPPKITLQKAVELAENYLVDQKMDLSPRFLSAAHYVDKGPQTNTSFGKGPCWQITWELKEASLGGEYFVYVYMDGKIGFAGGW